LANSPTVISAETAKRPNILFFFVDDQGWQNTSEPFWTQRTALNDTYHTPNMEKLARQGMKFTQAYACAVCSPSRVSLMTGMNAARHKVTNWTLHKDWSPDKEHPVVRFPEWNCNGLSRKPGVNRTVVAETLPALLRSAGYRTIHVGKAHFAADGTPSEDPCTLGFDVNIAGHCAGAPGSYQGLKNFARKGGSIVDVPGLEKYHGKDINLTDALTIEAKKQLGTAVSEGKPFYLYMSHYAVHGPWEPDNRFIAKYRTKKDGIKPKPAKIRTRYEDYASMIEGMDKSLGDLMEHIEKLGVAGDTIIVFMSDNGAELMTPRNRPLRGAKHQPYEGGVRVPMIVKWPGVTQPDSVCKNDYVIIEDVFPTFLEMAGVESYKQYGGKVDGRSFVPLLKGQHGLSRERAVFWHSPHYYRGQEPFSAVRQGDWKLICHHADQRLELFNLAEDIGETRNVAQKNPEKVNALAKTLGDHLREAGGQMPVIKETGRPVPFPDEML
jgi:arylsulfatase A-like enzyme